jgi:hypothetical protein
MTLGNEIQNYLRQQDNYQIAIICLKKLREQQEWSSVGFARIIDF